MTTSGRPPFWTLTRLRSVTFTALASIGLVLSAVVGALADAPQQAASAAYSGPSDRMHELPARPSPRSAPAIRTQFRSGRQLKALAFDDGLPGAVRRANEAPSLGAWKPAPAPPAVDAGHMVRIARHWATTASRAPPTG